MWIRTLLILVPALVCTLASAASETKLETPRSLALEVGLVGSSTESESDQARTAGLQLEAKWRDTLLEDLRTDVAAQFLLETGAARTRFNEEFRPRQGFRLRQASLSWTPLPELELQLGAQDQDSWNSPLLVHGQSFPSLLEKGQLQFGDFSVLLTAQQSFAADTSTFQPLANWASGTPTFLIERLSLKYAIEEKTIAELSAAHYLFDNLSSSAAYQSQFLGNSVLSPTPETAFFLQSFRGYEAAARLSHAWSRSFSTAVEYQRLQNLDVSGSEGLGWRAVLSLGFSPNERLALIPSGEIFELGTDVVPAIYNSRTRGHCNRKGMRFGLSALWPQSHFSVGAEYIKSDPISANAFQSSQQWIQLWVKTNYDLL